MSGEVLRVGTCPLHPPGIADLGSRVGDCHPWAGGTLTLLPTSSEAGACEASHSCAVQWNLDPSQAAGEPFPAQTQLAESGKFPFESRNFSHFIAAEKF